MQRLVVRTQTSWNKIGGGSSGGVRIWSSGFLEFDLGGVAEGVEDAGGKVKTRNQKLEIRTQKLKR